MEVGKIYLTNYKKCDILFLKELIMKNTKVHPNCRYYGVVGEICNKCGKMVTETSDLLAVRAAEFNSAEKMKEAILKVYDKPKGLRICRYDIESISSMEVIHRS